MSNTVLKNAEQFCLDHKHRFTQPREEVLRVIVSSQKPLGAYDILDALKKVLDNPKPPTAYRAIEFWQEHGFIHRIESLNAYVACKAGHQHKGSQFLICQKCGKVIETHLCSIPNSLQESASEHNFTPERWNLELYGACKDCSTH